MNPLIAKLGNFADLSDQEKSDLETLCETVQSARAGTDLILEGDEPERVLLLIEGWAYRYKLLPDGGRQIMAYLLPGDLCDVHVFILKKMDHSIGLLSKAKFVWIPKDRMLALFSRHPQLARALWWSTLTDEAVLREWIVNLGRRSAYDRIAHLFAELWLRLRVVGMTNDGALDLPLTQLELGDTMGLTAVHVNRVLSRMRDEGLITLKSGRLTIPDVQRLMDATKFEPNYLHLRTGRDEV